MKKSQFIAIPTNLLDSTYMAVPTPPTIHSFDFAYIHSQFPGVHILFADKANPTIIPVCAFSSCPAGGGNCVLPESAER